MNAACKDTFLASIFYPQKFECLKLTIGNTEDYHALHVTVERFELSICQKGGLLPTQQLKSNFINTSYFEICVALVWLHKDKY